MARPGNRFQRFRIHCAIAGLLAAVAVPRRAVAQLVATLNAGAAAIEYSDTLRAVATTLAPSLAYSGTRLAFDLGATVSGLESGAWAVGATADGVLRVARFGPVDLAIAGTAATSTYPGAGATTAGVARGILSMGGTRRGAWLGAGGGTRLSSMGAASSTVQLGAWLRPGVADLSLTITAAQGPGSVQYADASLGVGVTAGRVGLTLTGGVRGSARRPATWGAAEAVLRVRGPVSLVGSIGRALDEPLRGTPSMRYLSLSLRLARGRPGTPVRGSTVKLEPSSGERPGPGVVVEQSKAECRVLVGALGATSVEVMGDFTDWQPLVLSPAGQGWWELRLCIEPGVYQMVIRRDSGAWAVPAGLSALPDSYGGKVGLLVVQ